MFLMVGEPENLEEGDSADAQNNKSWAFVILWI